MYWGKKLVQLTEPLRIDLNNITYAPFRNRLRKEVKDSSMTISEVCTTMPSCTHIIMMTDMILSM